ncbi:MAG: caspase family protein, partial [Nitrospirae bacterium]|nr:caspase family protein [Nitrospirota bacterium]
LDTNKNRILEGGEEITLAVEVENKGKGMAKDIQVILSGDEALLKYFDKKIAVGDIKAGGKKTAKFQTILPTKVTPTVAEVSIEVTEGKGYSPADTKTFKIAMKGAAVKETIDVISDINVDDIPTKTRGVEQKDNYAVVIGITNYREKEIPSVKYATKDANSIAAYLENVARIPKGNIKLMLDSAATKSDLEAYIEDWLKRRANKDSTIYVFYAGHGTHDAQGKEAYIVPFEGHPDFPSKLYPLKRMYESLNNLSAKNVIVMLDSCFSGAEGKSVISAGARPLVISMENPALEHGKVMVLAASSGSQISSDYDKAQHGLFTYYLLKGLRGEADNNGDGTIEVGELFEYTKANVTQKASVEFNRDQTPVLLPAAGVMGNGLKLPIYKMK